MTDSITINVPLTPAQLAMIARVMVQRARHSGAGVEQAECLEIAALARKALDSLNGRR